MDNALVKKVAIAIHKQVFINLTKAWVDVDFRENEAHWLKVAEVAIKEMESIA